MTMYLTDLRIDAFGSVRDVSLERLGRGLTGVYGANGSGKTSVLQFIRGTFGDRSATFWNHSHTTPTGHLDVHTKDGRRKVTVHGSLQTSLLDSSAMAKLATVTAAEAHDTALVQQLADSVGVDLNYEAADFTAERQSLDELLAEKAELTADDGPLRATEDDMAEFDEAIAAARGEQTRTAERLSAQAQALKSAIRSTRREVDTAHGDYQAAQSDLTEWQQDAWRPRHITHEQREVVATSDAPTSRGTDLKTALLEIARLRCQASARRAEATAGGPLDLCAERLAEPIRIADELRDSLGRLRNAAGTVPAAGLASRVDDLIASLTDQKRAVDWLEADRTRVLLDRCERDLEQAALRSCSICASGATACDSATCTTTQEIEIVEPAADVEHGRLLADQMRVTSNQWQTALASHRQALRHLEQFEREVDRLAADDRLALLLAKREATLQRLAELHGRISVLNDSIAALRKILAEDRAPSGTLVDAGRYFQQLTCGHYSGLRTAANRPHELRAVTATGESLDLLELSRGTRAQAALAIRLAVLDILGEAGNRPPLILDDVLVESDRDRANAAIEVLANWSAHRQTILMTCQQQLIDALNEAEIDIMTLTGDSIAPKVRRESIVEATTKGTTNPIPTPVRATSHSTAAHMVSITPARETRFRSTSHATQSTKVASESKQASEKPTYWLDPDSMIVRTPSLSETDARRLDSLGIESIEHLLLVDVSAIESDLVQLQINPRDFVRWQSEARLLMLVPGLMSKDAQLLGWAGIHDPAELAIIDLGELRGRLTRLSRNKNARSLRIDTESFSNDRLNSWRSRAKRARSARSLLSNRPKLRSARRSRSDRTRRTESHYDNQRTSQRGNSSRQGQARTLSVVERRRSLRRATDESPSKSTRLSSERRIDPGSTKSVVAATETEWRHYLETQSPVVDAPSIGPKMAKRLGKLRIKTVSDLLQADPQSVAKGLNDRRIKKQTIINWQDQARLICRIPMLRGHDAQVLVACDFRDTESVAAANPKAMFAVVGPFVTSKEGERLLRSAKVPDLDEVSDWINWARHARALKAA